MEDVRVDLATLNRVRADLPRTPDEIIEVWLSTFIRRFGWPPAPGNDWKYVLRGSKDLSYLQSLEWRRTEVELTPSILSPRDLQTVTDLYRTHILGHPTDYGRIMTDGKPRYDRIVAYFKEHNTFPKPIALLEEGNTYGILDGNHRMSAFLYQFGYFQGTPETETNISLGSKHIVWIAETSNR
jgi:hypothetical protein